MYDKRQKIEKFNIAVLGFRSDVFLFYTQIYGPYCLVTPPLVRVETFKSHLNTCLRNLFPSSCKSVLVLSDSWAILFTALFRSDYRFLMKFRLGTAWGPGITVNVHHSVWPTVPSLPWTSNLSRCVCTAEAQPSTFWAMAAYFWAKGWLGIFIKLWNLHHLTFPSGCKQALEIAMTEVFVKGIKKMLMLFKITIKNCNFAFLNLFIYLDFSLWPNVLHLSLPPFSSVSWLKILFH